MAFEEKPPYVDDVRKLNGIPFRVAKTMIVDGKVTFREEWQTGYAYYMAIVKNGKGAHMTGTFKDNKFFTRPRYEKGNPTEDDYRKYTYKDPDSGNSRNYFEKKFIGEVQLLKPTAIPMWDRDEKKEIPKMVESITLILSNSVYKKVLEQLEDPRTNVYDYVQLSYNAKAAPALKYSVKFHQAGQPYAATTTNAATVTVGPTPTKTSNITLSRLEKDLLQEISGEETTPETVVDYLTTLARKNSLESLTPERIQTIASTVVVNGVVTL